MKAIVSSNGRSEEHRVLELSEAEAVDITVEFGRIYADCNDEGLVFKPLSRLPYDPSLIRKAMKVSYYFGYPLPEKLEHPYRHCYPQLAFFVPDDVALRAERAIDEHDAKFDRQALEGPIAPFRTDIILGLSGIDWGRSCAEAIETFHEHFDSDAPFVAQLGVECSKKMEHLAEEWARFCDDVANLRTDFEPEELARLRNELNSTKREADRFIEEAASRSNVDSVSGEEESGYRVLCPNQECQATLIVEGDLTGPGECPKCGLAFDLSEAKLAAPKAKPAKENLL